MMKKVSERRSRSSVPGQRGHLEHILCQVRMQQFMMNWIRLLRQNLQAMITLYVNQR